MVINRHNFSEWIITGNKTEVESVQLGKIYIADMDKCPQDKCYLDKCRGVVYVPRTLYLMFGANRASNS